jgi:hypothetical protein
LVVARAKGSDVDTVMIDGEIVMEGRQHRKVDRASLVAAVKEVVRAQLNDPGRAQAADVMRRIAVARSAS